MISLYAIMLVLLGFFLAALVLVMVLPAYRRRIERFSEQALKQALPLTEDEIRADKDRLRAAFAIDVHKLEIKLDEARHAAARQSVEINRRDARIQELNEAVAAHAITVAEHENARRVLEQAILDRLPKVEQRLTETRRLLAARDREIMHLTHTGAKQAAALEDATQLNRQQTEELARTKAAIETRNLRNRDAAADNRADAEVALRTEIEMLRAKTREQAALIDRLQDAADERDGDSGASQEVARLQVELARVESELAEALADRAPDIASSELAERLADVEQREREQIAEIARLKASLGAFESGGSADLADKAQIAALQTEAAEHRRVMDALRAELTSANERLARQGERFHEEVRRLRDGTDRIAPPAELPQRLSLAERVVNRKPPRLPDQPVVNGAETAKPAQAFLKAVNDAGPGEEAASAAPAEKAPLENAPRRSRLLERINRLDKQA